MRNIKAKYGTHIYILVLLALFIKKNYCAFVYRNSKCIRVVLCVWFKVQSLYFATYYTPILIKCLATITLGNIPSIESYTIEFILDLLARLYVK